MEIPNSLIEQVKDGNVVLFLGSGASFDALHPSKIQPPLGSQFADMLSKKFLGGRYNGCPLAYVSELAISEYDIFTVQKFIYDEFEPFFPNKHHLQIPDYIWKAIISTNFDFIIERAYARKFGTIQNLAIFIKNGERVRERITSSRDLPYYKIHGCISEINDEQIPLILTPDQYVTHKVNRDRLYSRIQELAYEHPFLFVGFSFADSDIRAMLNEINKGIEAKPRSFMVGPNITEEEQRLWEGKKITGLKMSFKDFLNTLDLSIDREFRKLVILRSAGDYKNPIFKKFTVNPEDVKPSGSLLDFLENDVQYIHEAFKTVDTDPKAFYKGYFENWDPILKNLDCPRKIEDGILSETILDESGDVYPSVEFYVIKGYAGSGKSVLLKRLAWDAGISFEKICLFFNPNTILKYDPINELYTFIKDRLYLFIDNISDYNSDIINIIEKAKRDKLKITIIGAVRMNIWNTECDDLKNYITGEYLLRYLEDKEIVDLINLLEKNDSLGYLKNKSQEERIQELSYRAGRELLVALYEATMGKPFTEIIIDEYNSISNPRAQSLYLTVSILHRLGTEARAGLISRVHDISFTEFREKLFLPLEFIVFDRRDYRINDYVYLTRHKQIAEIIFENVLKAVQDRYDEYIRILSCLDIDYENDRIAFLSMTKAKNLKDIFPDSRMVRELYKIASESSHRDAKLMQQEAIFEMTSKDGNLSRADFLLTNASKLAPKDNNILHSFAEMALIRAEKSIHKIEVDKYLSESEGICIKILGQRQNNPHPFHTLIKIHIFKLKRIIEDQDTPSIERAIKETEKTLTQAKQLYPDHEFILESEAEFNDILSKRPEAIQLLEKAFALNKRSPFICLRLSSFYEDSGNNDRAKEILEESLQLNPSEKDVNFKYAILLCKDLAPNYSDVKFYLRRSFTQGDNRYQAQFWFARALYLNNEIEEANNVFDVLKTISVDPKVKSRHRGIVKVDGVPITFKGTIIKKEHSFGFLKRDTISDSVYFYRFDSGHDYLWDNLSSGKRVRFILGFNYHGPVAIKISLE